MVTKPELRARMMAARGALSAEDRARFSARAVKRLLDSHELQVAQTIALFAAMRGEADPAGLEEAAESGRLFVYPRIEGDRLVFCPATRDSLVPGTWGILEPTTPPVPLAIIDLVVAPGLAFSRSGDRLGYGRGFYDRAIAELRRTAPDARIAGFAYALQVHDTIPTGPEDQRLDALVTEDELLRFGPRPV